MKPSRITPACTFFAAALAACFATSPAHAQPAATAKAAKQPNIITIISDDFGWGDAGPYGGGEGRGMPTPNLDRIAKEGMTFYSFYGQPSCTPGRAAMLTGRAQRKMSQIRFLDRPESRTGS